MTAPRTAVRRLALARVISVTGSAAAYTALMFEIYDQTGSSGWLAGGLYSRRERGRVHGADVRDLRPDGVLGLARGGADRHRGRDRAGRSAGQRAGGPVPPPHAHAPV